MEGMISVVKSVVTYIIPIIALFISFLSLKQSNRVSRIEEKIKTYELEKIEAEKSREPKADIDVRMVDLGNHKYKLKIWNSGDATAYNIDFDIPEKYEINAFNDKTPFEYLSPKDSFDENVVLHYGGERKFTVVATWEDQKGEKYRKEKLCSV